MGRGVPDCRPTLVLLPGLDGTGRLFEPLRKALGDTCPIRVIAYPGEHFLDYPALTDYARQRLPDGPLVLLGESFSGPIATRLAATERRVVRLILSTSFVRTPSPWLGVFNALLRALPAGHVPMRLFMAPLLGDDDRPELRALIHDAAAAVAPAVLRARLRAVAEVDVTAELAQLRIPVAYWQAIHDRIVPAAAGRWVAHHAPGCELRRFAAPHCLLQTQPHAAAAALQEPLRDC